MRFCDFCGQGRLLTVESRALAVVSADLANRTGRCIAAHRLRDADGYGLVTSSLRGHAATVRRLPMVDAAERLTAMANEMPDGEP